MKALGIIGTAGRGRDGDRLTPTHFERMTNLSRYIFDKCAKVAPLGLTSGGAAWADHCAVALVLSGHVPFDQFWLFLPAAFDLRTKRFAETSQRFCPGRTSNYYHDRFSRVIGRNSLAEIAQIIEDGRAHVTVDPKGFLSRNTLVAKRANRALLAFTFSLSCDSWSVSKYGNNESADEAGLSDPGTANTWNKAVCRKYHACL